MMVILSGRIVLGVYAALLGVGGVMGFVRARSRASLIAGSISSAACLALLAWSFVRPGASFRFGAILAGLLMANFASRAFRKKKFLPAGLLAIVSLAVLIALGLLQMQLMD